MDSRIATFPGEMTILNSESNLEQRNCLDCGHGNRPTANYCENCGELLPDEAPCPRCGELCGVGQRFCHVCGLSLSRKGPQIGAAPNGSDSSLAAGQGQGSSDSDSFESQGLSRRVISAFKAMLQKRVLELSSSPDPTDTEVLNGPSAIRGRPGTANPVSSEESARLGPPATIRANVFWAVVAIVVAIGGQWLLGLGLIVAAICLYAVGIALAVWAFRRNTDDAVPAANSGTIWKISPIWLAPILLLPALPTALSLTSLLTNPRLPPNSFWLLHIASVALFIVCVYFVDRQQAFAGTHAVEHLRKEKSSQSTRIEGEPRPWMTTERLAAVAIMCIGLFLRLYDLPEFPFGTWYDEADFALQAQRILEEPNYRPLFIDPIHGPAHYIYLVSSLFLVLPDVTFVIRFASVLLGTLSIAAAFMAGNQLFGRGPGLILAFLVAVSRWSVNFSRIGMFNIPVTLFAFLGIGFLLRALHRNRLTDYMWAGLLLGLGHNFYLAFTLFLMVISVFVLRYFVSNYGLLRHQWKGLLVAAMGVALFLAPLAVFAQEEPDIYFRRTRTVSIFNEYTSDEVVDKLRESAVTHFLMYNFRGDPNGRHNLPGEPTLAPVAGALFLLGLGISLGSLWRRRSLLLIFWLLVMMSGGIFALSFEAPQSLRAIGALPAVYLLATLPLAMLWKNWRAASAAPIAPKESVDGGTVASNGLSVLLRLNVVLIWLQSSLVRRGPVLFVCFLLVAIALHNYKTYFTDQRYDFSVWNAYSTGESIAASIIAENAKNADTEIFLTSHFAHHPTVRFVANAESSYQSVDYTATLPMSLSPDRNTLFLMDPERRNFFEQARSFYPSAEFIEHKPPFGGPTVLYEIRLSPADISSIQGMNLSYFEGEAWTGSPVKVERHSTVSVDWPRGAPLSIPFSAEWKGVLNIEEYGPHKFVLRAPAGAELYVDEDLVAQIETGAETASVGDSGEVSAALKLAMGLHRLRIRAVGGQGPVSLSWQRPGEAEQIVPTSALHVPPVSSNGLLGRYYANGSWQEPAAFTRIDPQINLYFHDIPLPRPYTVEWEGKLAIPYDGVYRMGIESIDESELWIDGKEVAASPEPNQYDEDSIELTAGLHDIRIRYVARTSHYHVNLHWAPPGQERSQVQAEALIPPQGSYDHLSVDDLAIFFATSGTSFAALPVNVTPLPVDEERTAAFEIVRDTFERPRGVATANGRLYVVDSSQRSLFVMDGDGRRIAEIRRSNRRFSEPVDVAADASGNIYVLDAGNGGQVSIHDADGDFVRVVPLSDNMVEKSRGLDVDREGRIWLAITPALAVAAFNADGQELARFSTVLEGGDLQPVDVAFHSDDAVYVSTAGPTSVIRFSLSGEPLNLWPLASANSADGPHLSLDRGGALYVTQPELGGFLRISGDEEQGIEVWELPASQPIRKLVGIKVGPDGELLLTDSENGRVYRVSMSP